jgi:hypothetical protein
MVHYAPIAGNGFGEVFLPSQAKFLCDKQRILKSLGMDERQNRNENIRPDLGNIKKQNRQPYKNS